MHAEEFDNDTREIPFEKPTEWKPGSDGGSSLIDNNKRDYDMTLLYREQKRIDSYQTMEGFERMLDIVKKTIRELFGIEEVQLQSTVSREGFTQIFLRVRTNDYEFEKIQDEFRMFDITKIIPVLEEVESQY